jgi:hypothetical protein
MTLDHGYAVDEQKRCSATTKKQKQCTQHALAGLQKCALHAGLAKPRRDSHYGDPQALEAYKRALVQPASARGGNRPSNAL